jgi:hypothetical protein
MDNMPFIVFAPSTSMNTMNFSRRHFYNKCRKSRVVFGEEGRPACGNKHSRLLDCKVFSSKRGGLATSVVSTANWLLFPDHSLAGF